MKYEDGLVSVVIPTYKRSVKIIRAIESVLNQTYTNLELLLVNDNEINDEYTEALINTVKKFQNDNRFRLIFQEKHINGAAARNVAIKEARGEFVAFLDDDDWWKNNKLEKQVETIKSLPKDWGCVSCRIEQFCNEKIVAKLPKYKDGKVYKDILFQQCDFATGTLLFRHDALDDAGYFDEKLPRNQDWQLLINFTYKYKLFQLDECLHCCDIGDAMNRPNGDKAIEYKRLFFESIEPIFRTLTRAEKNAVRAITNFEIGYIYFKEKKYGRAFRYSIKLLRSPIGCYQIVKKGKLKIMGRRKLG